MTTNKAIWCYAEGKPGEWEALCMNFDLSVQGGSFDEVCRDLKEAISMYLDYVGKLPKEEQKQFLNRKAAISLRLKFILTLLLLDIFKTREDDKDCAGFLVHCQV